MPAPMWPDPNLGRYDGPDHNQEMRRDVWADQVAAWALGLFCGLTLALVLLSWWGVW